MKLTHHVILACLVLALAGCAATTTTPAASPADNIPKKFIFSVATVVGPSYHVELADGLLVYSVTEPGKKQKPPLHVAPSDDQWKEFHHQLDRINVWQWKPKYGNEQFVSGTQWSLEIEYADHTVHSQGHRDFPRHYDRFLKAVGNVLGSWQID